MKLDVNRCVSPALVANERLTRVIRPMSPSKVAKLSVTWKAKKNGDKRLDVSLYDMAKGKVNISPYKIKELPHSFLKEYQTDYDA